MELGEKLKIIRLENRMTLEQLSKISNVSKSQLSQIERGFSNPTVTKLQNIVKALKISFSDLFEDTIKISIDSIEQSSPPTEKKQTVSSTKVKTKRSKDMSPGSKPSQDEINSAMNEPEIKNVKEILGASKEQETGIKQINDSVLQISKTTQDNAANSEEMAASSSKLMEQADSFHRIVGDLLKIVTGSGRMEY